MAELSDITGLTLQAIQRRETGTTKVKPPERELFAKAFGITLSEFNDRCRTTVADPDVTGPGIPIINKAPTGDAVDYEEHGVEVERGFEFVDYGGLRTDENLFAVVVVGDSMQPTLHDGDRVIFRPLPRFKTHPNRWEDGRVYFVRYAEGHGAPACTIARVRRMTDGSIMLSRDNPMQATTVLDPDHIDSIAIAVERRSGHML